VAATSKEPRMTDQHRSIANGCHTSPAPNRTLPPDRPFGLTPARDKPENLSFSSALIDVGQAKIEEESDEGSND
jgi:hypothetical protein